MTADEYEHELELERARRKKAEEALVGMRYEFNVEISGVPQEFADLTPLPRLYVFFTVIEKAVRF